MMKTRFLRNCKREPRSPLGNVYFRQNTGCPVAVDLNNPSGYEGSERNLMTKGRSQSHEGNFC